MAYAWRSILLIYCYIEFMSKKYKADKKAIRALKEKAKLKQTYFKDHHEGFSYRNYQRAEAGEKLSKDVLIAIAKFYDQYFKTNKGSKNNITLEDIVEKEIKDENVKEEPIESQKTFKEESSYLYKVENHNQLEQVIKISDFRRKIFYMFDPDATDAKLIKNFLTDITQLKMNKKNFYNDSDSFNELDNEINKLNKITNIGLGLVDLKKNNITVYAGNYNLPVIWMDPVDPGSLEYDESFRDETGEYKSSVKFLNYAIICFSKNAIASSITFVYRNYWFKEKLEKLNKEFDFRMNGPFGICHGECEDHFKNQFKGYSDRIDKEKTNLVETDVYDLLTDEEINQIGEDYIRNEAENRAMDMYDDD